MDVTDVSLEKFKAKGGKIIMTHGTADDFITPHNTELYYKRQVKQFGKAGVDSFIRFYMIPGFGHGFGPFNAKIDSLTALQNWVEKGQAPAGLDGDRRQPERQPRASAVRVAEVAEVHRRARERGQRRQLHLRRAVEAGLSWPERSRRQTRLVIQNSEIQKCRQCLGDLIRPPIVKGRTRLQFQVAFRSELTCVEAVESHSDDRTRAARRRRPRDARVAPFDG